MKRILLAAACAAAMAAAGAASAHDEHEAVQATTSGAASDKPLNTTAKKFGTWGFDTSGMDRAAKPGDSFHRYASGAALDRMEIPADRTSWGAFPALSELSENRIESLIREFAAKPNPTAGEAQIANFYKSFMDEARVEALDAKPLQADLATIRNARTRPQLARQMGASHGTFGGSFFGGYVNEDSKQPNVNVVFLAQSGLGLPDRDYYLTDRFSTQKAAYRAYVEKMLTMAG